MNFFLYDLCNLQINSWVCSQLFFIAITQTARLAWSTCTSPFEKVHPSFHWRRFRLHTPIFWSVPYGAVSATSSSSVVPPVPVRIARWRSRSGAPGRFWHAPPPEISPTLASNKPRILCYRCPGFLAMSPGRGGPRPCSLVAYQRCARRHGAVRCAVWECHPVPVMFS